MTDDPACIPLSTEPAPALEDIHRQVVELRFPLLCDPGDVGPV